MSNVLMSKRRGLFAWLGAMMVSCALLSGCGGPAATTTATTDGSASGTSGENATGMAAANTTAGDAGGEQITIGYSDWPGWAPWSIAEKQGFFKKRGVNVKMVWFPVYTDSLNALSAGQVDANSQTWSDTMAPLAQGVDLKVVLVNDNSYGNDSLIGKPGIASIKQLKGKKVATELGTCDHFLLLKALEASGMTEKDIQFTNIKIQDCPAAMLSSQVDAAVVWEPSRTKILKEMKGSREIYTSRDMPGLIPDLLVSSGKLVRERPDDVQKIVLAWYDALDWLRKNPDAGIATMAKLTGTPPADYKAFIKGTRIFSAPEGLAALTKSDKPTSLYASGGGIAKFLMEAQQVSKVPDYAAVIEPRFVREAVKQGLAKQPPFDYAKK